MSGGSFTKTKYMTATSRRDFLKNAGLTVGGFLIGCQTKTHRATDRFLAGNSSEYKMGSWLFISADNQLIFLLDKAEMGQGVITSLPAIVGEELNTDPSLFEVRPAPLTEAYDNPAFEVYATGGSTSVAASWEALRQMAAYTKTKLLKEGAKILKAKPEDCYLQNKKIHLKADSNKYVLFGQVAESTSKAIMILPKKDFKPRENFQFLGKKILKKDSLSKITGACQYAIDIELPNMAYAKVLRCPNIGGKLKSFDAKAARTNQEIFDVFEIQAGVVIVASSYWHALNAQDAIEIEWDIPESARQINNQSITEEFKRASTNIGVPVVALKASLTPTDQEASAFYEVPYAPHIPMEPPSCVAYVQSHACEVWVGTQMPTAARAAAALASNMSQQKVFIYPQLMGGSFGRRLAQDFVYEAVEISKIAKRPIKLIWSREDDIRHDFYRPASGHRLQAGLSQKKTITLWRQHVIAPSIFKNATNDISGAFLSDFVLNPVLQFAQSSIGLIISAPVDTFDPTSFEGVAHFPYKIGQLGIYHISRPSSLPIGFWRSVGYSGNVFVVESFMDELAAQAGVDPLQFRTNALSELAKHPHPPNINPTDLLSKLVPLRSFHSSIFADIKPARALRVLEKVAQMANWGNTPSGVYHGVAQSACFGSYCAQVVEIKKVGDLFKINKIYVAVDAGFIVNPDGAKEQIEGGIIFALTAAIKHKLTVIENAVQQSNFHDLDLMRMYEIPTFEIHFMDSSAEPTGVGELGVPATAPALANALFRATGIRHRTLPFPSGIMNY